MRVSRVADRSASDICVTSENEGERALKRRSKWKDLVENGPQEVHFDLAGSMSSKWNISKVK